uniref:Uncharacterized protein n=1 Tax=Brassica oleracea TaxID=3712 RepID=A0A3P6G0B6_BRAOL|nr:unnamed protein product [Brassica oleracea]
MDVLNLCVPSPNLFIWRLRRLYRAHMLGSVLFSRRYQSPSPTAFHQPSLTASLVFMPTSFHLTLRQLHPSMFSTELYSIICKIWTTMALSPSSARN